MMSHQELIEFVEYTKEALGEAPSYLYTHPSYIAELPKPLPEGLTLRTDKNCPHGQLHLTVQPLELDDED